MAITGITILVLYLLSQVTNSFEDWAPVDFIYGCPIFKWVAGAWLHGRVPGWYPQQWLPSNMPFYIHSVCFALFCCCLVLVDIIYVCRGLVLDFREIGKFCHNWPKKQHKMGLDTSDVLSPLYPFPSPFLSGDLVNDNPEYIFEMNLLSLRYCEISNIRCTKSQNLNVSRLV